MSNMVLAFQITAVGMGLVFGAILLLWGMMTLLTALTADNDTSTVASTDSAQRLSANPASDSPMLASVMETDSKAQIAALAVAIALAEQQASTARPLPEPPTAIVSAWQLGMRTRQMAEKGNIRRH